MDKELMVVFVGDRLIGFSLDYVREIFSVKKVIPVPGSKDFIKGIVNYRGNVIPIVNLKSILGMENISYEEKVLEYTVIVEYNDIILGVMVDKIKSIFEIKEEVLENQKIPDIKDIDEQFISSIVEIDGEKVLVMDVSNLISIQ